MPPLPGKTASSPGFTLIEVLVAVILITLVIVPLDRLVIRAERISETAHQRFVATNLAQEGLELARTVRDNNWFSSTEAERWLDHGLCQEGDRSYEDRDRQFTLDPELVRNGRIGDSEQSQLYRQDHGLLTHTPSDQEAQYSRLISLDCSTKFAEQPHVTVTSRVTWQGRGDTREITLKEKLYNWYPAAQATASP